MESTPSLVGAVLRKKTWIVVVVGLAGHYLIGFANAHPPDRLPFGTGLYLPRLLSAWFAFHTGLVLAQTLARQGRSASRSFVVAGALVTLCTVVAAFALTTHGDLTASVHVVSVFYRWWLANLALGALAAGLGVWMAGPPAWVVAMATQVVAPELLWRLPDPQTLPATVLFLVTRSVVGQYTMIFPRTTAEGLAVHPWFDLLAVTCYACGFIGLALFAARRGLRARGVG
jgi:hypothetical protein